MCWETKNKLCVCIAEKDMHVKKIMREVDGDLYSYFENFFYEPGMDYVCNVREFYMDPDAFRHADADDNPGGYGLHINKAFHSYNDCIAIKKLDFMGGSYIVYGHESWAEDGAYELCFSYPMKTPWLENPDGTIVLAECVIPKGTRYAVNEFEEIVSEAMRVESYTPMEELPWNEKEIYCSGNVDK